MSVWKRILTLNRAELWFNSVMTLIWPVIVAASSITEVLSFRAVWTLLTCILIRHAGFVLNAVSDYELDKESPFKERFTSNIDYFGKKKCLMLGILEMTIAVIMLGVLSIGLKQRTIWLFVVFAWDIVNLLMYNHPKIKFKSKGILNAYCMMVRGISVPLLISWISMGVNFTTPYLLIMIGIFIEVGGGSIFFSMFDYKYDKNSGCNTFPVKHGLVLAMQVHIALRIVGAVLLLTGWYMFSGIPVSATILLLSYIYSIAGFIYYYSKNKQSLEELCESQKFKVVTYGITGLMGLPRTLLILASVLKIFGS